MCVCDSFCAPECVIAPYRQLLSENVKSPSDFKWLGLMRFYFDPKQPDVMKQLTIHVANTRTFYGCVVV